MTHRKNGFWNLCFSAIPGAGQMYQGFIKRGVSIMALFFGWLMVCAFFEMDEGLFFVPVIWFFGFFDSLHRNSLTEEERKILKDEFLFVHGDADILENFSLREFRIPVAVLLIFFGGYSLLQQLLEALVDAGFLSWHNEIFQLVYYRMPKMVFAFAIIFLGIYLIRGKREEIMGKEEKKEEENMPWMTKYYEEETDQNQPESNNRMQEETTVNEQSEEGEGEGNEQFAGDKREEGGEQV